MFARTERLLLRPGWREDAPAFFRAVADEGIVRNLAQAPWPYTLADAEAFLMRDRHPRLADLRRDRRRRHRAVADDGQQLDAERAKGERSTHFNKCPRCGADLKAREHHHVKVDECQECGGVWLDKGELDMIKEFDRGSSGFMGSLFRFKR